MPSSVHGRLYDAGGAGDSARAVAVGATPDSRVFVTDQSAIRLGEFSSDVDHATVAYFDP